MWVQRMLTSVFGFSVKYEAWNYQDFLHYRQLRFSYSLYWKKRCIILAPTEELTSLLVQKIAKIQQIDNVPVVLELAAVSKYRKKALQKIIYRLLLKNGFFFYMLVSVPPQLSIAQFMGYLKGKSSLMIFDRHANLKHKYGQRSFQCRGYYVDTVGKNETTIRQYIRNQLEEDYTKDKISLKEYIDPFTGSKNRQA